MGTEVEVELGGMCDYLIHRRARRYVAWFAHLVLFLGTEEARVVTFLNHNESDARLVADFQFQAGLPNGAQFVVKYLVKEDQYNQRKNRDNVKKNRSV